MEERSHFINLVQSKVFYDLIISQNPKKHFILDDNIGFSGEKHPKVSIFLNETNYNDSDNKFNINKKVVSVKQKVREELLESSFVNLKMSDTEPKSK